MIKTLISISLFLLISCSTNNDDTVLQNQDDNQKQVKNTLSQSRTSLSETVIMDFSIGAIAPPQNGGCSSNTRDSHDNPVIDNSGFGPDPINFLGYKIRGFGRPTTTIYYAGISFFILNKAQRAVSTTGETFTINNPKSQAISIEQVFEPNFTYEIRLKAYINDIIANDKNGNYDIEKSEGRPTIKVELKQTPEIPGERPCEFMSSVSTGFLGVSNNLKEQKIDHYATDGIYTFNFSPVVKTNSLVIYFLPEMSVERNSFVPQSTFGMKLTNIKIIQKPFDPSHYITPRGNPNPCGSRTGVCP